MYGLVYILSVDSLDALVSVKYFFLVETCSTVRDSLAKVAAGAVSILP